jgi:hypothetical protein
MIANRNPIIWSSTALLVISSALAISGACTFEGWGRSEVTNGGISLAFSAQLLLNATQLEFVSSSAAFSFSSESKLTLVRGASLTMSDAPIQWAWGSIELVDSDTSVTVKSGSLQRTSINGCGTLQILIYDDGFDGFNIHTPLSGGGGTSSSTCPLQLKLDYLSTILKGIGVTLNQISVKNVVITTGWSMVMEWYGSVIQSVEYHTTSSGYLYLSGGSTWSTKLYDVLLDLTGSHTVEMRTSTTVVMNNVTILFGSATVTPINIRSFAKWSTSNAVRIFTPTPSSSIITISSEAQLTIDDIFYCQTLMTSKSAKTYPYHSLSLCQ